MAIMDIYIYMKIILDINQNNDENQQPTPYDALHVLIGLVTRVGVKSINEAFNEIIRDIWANKTLRIPSKMVLSIKFSF